MAVARLSCTDLCFHYCGIRTAISVRRSLDPVWDWERERGGNCRAVRLFAWCSSPVLLRESRHAKDKVSFCTAAECAFLSVLTRVCRCKQPKRTMGARSGQRRVEQKAPRNVSRLPPRPGVESRATCFRVQYCTCVWMLFARALFVHG